MKYEQRKIKLSAVKTDPRYQSRAKLNEAVVIQYQEALESGATLPPIKVVQIDGTMFVADGFHRLEAYRRRNVTEIQAMVGEGSHADAIKAAAGANATHGLPRTRADKRRAVEMLLALPEAAGTEGIGDREVARIVGVSHTFVAQLKRKMQGGTAKKPATAGKSSAVPATTTTPASAPAAKPPAAPAKIISKGAAPHDSPGTSKAPPVVWQRAAYSVPGAATPEFILHAVRASKAQPHPDLTVLVKAGKLLAVTQPVSDLPLLDLLDELDNARDSAPSSLNHKQTEVQLLSL